jgi:geranylgeranyl diphosphate synthase, type II
MTIGNSTSPPGQPNDGNDHFFSALTWYRDLILERIQDHIPKNRYHRTLYGPMLEYPMRDGKGFRPALCLSMCQACGGKLEDGIDTAAALEMFHNAFLIHDDVEDASESRRGYPTLHRMYGIPIATNVGDGLNMLAMRTLLRNTETMGLERALTIIHEVERLARETTEGQSLELDWVHGSRTPVRVRDYFLMVYKKTCWYTCIAPLRLGTIIAGVDRGLLDSLIPLGFRIGAAFQIQDDILNLEADEKLYGKEIGGDIAEGKRTLMAIHALQTSDGTTREKLSAVYAKPRELKTPDEIEWVLKTMHEHGSIDYARNVARRYTLSAQKLFRQRFDWLHPSPHKAFLEEMFQYMIDRKL